MSNQLIKKEKFTSIQEAQAGLTKLFKKAQKEGSIYRVLRNNKSLGVLLPNAVWESLLEDIEAMNSPNYLESIKEARSSNKLYSAKEVRNLLNLD